MSNRFVDIIVIAIDPSDVAQWIVENPELAGSGVTIVPTADRGWSAVAPSTLGFAATTYIMTEAAAQSPLIGGTESPRWFRIADAIAERRRPRYLGAAA